MPDGKFPDASVSAVLPKGVLAQPAARKISDRDIIATTNFIFM
jgi:hypothetical protein